MVKRNISATV